MNSENMLVFGAGYIGRKIAEYLKCPLMRVKIHTYQDIEEQIEYIREKGYSDIKIIINAIGYVGENSVDDCEQNQAETYFANVVVPMLLADYCLKHNLYFVHIGSGCMYHYDYETDTPVSEEREPNFFDLAYVRSKIAIEKILLNRIMTNTQRILICRIRIPLDDQPNPRNLLDKLLRYDLIIDANNSITYLPEFLKILKILIAKEVRGIINLVNTGGLYYPDLLIYYNYLAEKNGFSKHNFDVIDYNKLGVPRTNLLMSVEKLTSIGIVPRDINKDYKQCVNNYIQNLIKRRDAEC
ncbi:MAG: hypothetical protein UR93_C0022G0004 [Berkelbacteria bacterium GW2011_GWA2_35_9]|uniref:dTDP-4-dehydrorhamnose reductase n=1 Tax=Berkelbacteria bacterium GW2011_GWA2_35_9 TaxID=1618333 RepID=A0A0G0D1G8_9BACT|nr:MAG: hypothetical protein UR93_C0022G0004 [Berkelbacteria bacterium GW2011_GWA2_35_9]